MKILNFGSLNLDKVYKVAHFVREGETISAQEQNQFLGGKGLNQSVDVYKRQPEGPAAASPFVRTSTRCPSARKTGWIIAPAMKA